MISRIVISTTSKLQAIKYLRLSRRFTKLPEQDLYHLIKADQTFRKEKLTAALRNALRQNNDKSTLTAIKILTDPNLKAIYDRYLSAQEAIHQYEMYNPTPTVDSWKEYAEYLEDPMLKSKSYQDMKDFIEWYKENPFEDPDDLLNIQRRNKPKRSLTLRKLLQFSILSAVFMLLIGNSPDPYPSMWIKKSDEKQTAMTNKDRRLNTDDSDDLPSKRSNIMKPSIDDIRREFEQDLAKDKVKD